jgi:hypothetical protein
MTKASLNAPVLCFFCSTEPLEEVIEKLLVGGLKEDAGEELGSL